MIKNYLLYLIFSILLLAFSATACLAGQESEVSQQQKTEQQQSAFCCSNPEESRISESKDVVLKVPSKKDYKEDETQDVSPSILNSNFIFYILFKFKFVDNRGGQHHNEVEEKATIPLLSYTRSVYMAINSLFEKKFF